MRVVLNHVLQQQLPPRKKNPLKAGPLMSLFRFWVLQNRPITIFPALSHMSLTSRSSWGPLIKDTYRWTTSTVDQALGLQAWSQTGKPQTSHLVFIVIYKHVLTTAKPASELVRQAHNRIGWGLSCVFFCYPIVFSLLFTDKLVKYIFLNEYFSMNINVFYFLLWHPMSCLELVKLFFILITGTQNPQ